MRHDIARYFQDQPSWTEIEAWIGPVEVDEEMMHAPEEMGAAGAGDVAVELMQVRHHLESETFDVKSWTFFLSRGRDLSWSSPRGSVSCSEHSSCGNPHLAVACRFSGDSARCAPWSLIVVSDLIPEHLYLPSSTLAVSAHLHAHGREAPRSTGRTGQWTTEVVGRIET